MGNVLLFDIDRINNSNAFGHFRLILYFLLTTLIICAPALYNGYPLLFSDTGTYVSSAFMLKPPSSRPVGYGLFINLFSFHFTLWSVMFIQSLFMNLLIYKVLRIIFPGSKIFFKHFTIIVILMLVSSLSWYGCQIMPDIFTSGMLLIIVLVFTRDKITIGEGILLSVLYFFFIISHLSHFPLTFMVLVTILILKLIRVKLFVNKKLFFRRLIWLALIMVVSSLVLRTHHYSHGKGFRISLTSNVFLAARLTETGILKDYLEETCDGETNILCDDLENLPTTVNGFLWLDSSPMKKAGLNWEQADSAFSDVIYGVFTSPKYLLRFSWESIKATSRQLFNVDIGSGLIPYKKNSPPYYPIKAHMGNESVEMLVTAQSFGQLDFKFFNLINYFILSISLIIIFWATYYRKLNRNLVALIVVTAVGIIYNAAITASLSNISDRKQARLTWLVVFIALIIVFTLIDEIKALLSPHIKKFKEQNRLL